MADSEFSLTFNFRLILLGARQIFYTRSAILKTFRMALMSENGVDVECISKKIEVN